MKKALVYLLTFVLFCTAFAGCDSSATYREVAPSDNSRSGISDYFASNFYSFVSKANIAAIIRGKLTDIKEYEFDPLFEHEKSTNYDYKIYESLLSVDVADVIWDGGTGVAAGQSVKTLVWDTSYRRVSNMQRLEKGCEYIFMISRTKASEDAGYDFDKVSGYTVNAPEYFVMRLDGDTVYFNDYGLRGYFSAQPERVDPPSVYAIENTYYAQYGDVKAALLKLMDSIDIGAEPSPSPTPKLRP